MSGPAASGGRSLGTRFFAGLHALSSGCSRLPLLAGVALVVSARVVPLLEEPAPQPVVPEMVAQEAVSEEAALIDAVLAKRAPDLGLTLRRRLGQAIDEESRRTGYDPLLVLALIDVESDFEEESVSEKGARGLMQIKPSTLHFLAEKEGLKLSREEVVADPAVCVRLGIRYLRSLQGRFGGDLDLALMAYNAGPTRIRDAMKAGELEKFRRYPRAVRRDFRRFREGHGLGGDWALAQREPPPETPGETPTAAP
ncbi:lytic transglycosylase domain-containing protein [Corallococcus carmarthensis]|uniref:Lytic transglycosylase domain-containing protein n=1 Tax=Corallococcus carmarthensis TaxID=2316728 RepID=A0A3A8JY18_9BACT|nr:lytic transglycosylase domain-containing protein [Corallococcus carmarthensis]NOK18131.1 transglycosylase SLT domain-containing protein [Corallococcus carmarthensis]RKH00076.1 lytic transglycosylase domain-containing protein [Corallococcus carmarthensis]